MSTPLQSTSLFQPKSKLIASMAATGLLQYYFFPTDFLYPRRQKQHQQNLPPLQPQKAAEPVSDRNQPSKAAAAPLVLRNLHGNSNDPRRNVSIGKKNGLLGGCDEKSYGGWEAELTPLHLSCPVSIPAFLRLPYGMPRFQV